MTVQKVFGTMILMDLIDQAGRAYLNEGDYEEAHQLVDSIRNYRVGVGWGLKDPFGADKQRLLTIEEARTRIDALKRENDPQRLTEREALERDVARHVTELHSALHLSLFGSDPYRAHLYALALAEGDVNDARSILIDAAECLAWLGRSRLERLIEEADHFLNLIQSSDEAGPRWPSGPHK